MTRFRFPLEGLLKLRRLEEDRVKASFLLRLKDFRLREDEIAGLVRRREEAKDRLRSATGGALDIEELLRSRRFINILFGRIEEKRVELVSLRPALEEARSAHRQAATRRRALEKVRERAWKEFVREEERKERRDLDEVGQVQFLRARAEEAGKTEP